MISLLDFIHPALPGPNLPHSGWGTIWPYAGRNHGPKMRHKWPPVGSLRWPSTIADLGPCGRLSTGNKLQVLDLQDFAHRRGIVYFRQVDVFRSDPGLFVCLTRCEGTGASFGI